jgi:D-xylose transport system ATP-binding protein
LAVSTRTPVIEVRGVSKRFGPVQALKDVDFEVYPGEVVGLVGDNGAGKSTLIKILAGTYQPDTGRYLFEGREVHVRSPRDATALGIATVYQDLALCDNLDVVANLYLGREDTFGPPGPLALLDEIDMEKRASEVLTQLAIKIPSVRTPVAALSGGQRQTVAVARAVMRDAKAVVLDEPTAALGVSQTRQVLDLVKRLRDRGLGVVLISHNLANVFAVCDRIIVLWLGRRVATFDVRGSTREDVVAAITGAQFGEGGDGEDDGLPPAAEVGA